MDEGDCVRLHVGVQDAEALIDGEALELRVSLGVRVGEDDCVFDGKLLPVPEPDAEDEPDAVSDAEGVEVADDVEEGLAYAMQERTTYPLPPAESSDPPEAPSPYPVVNATLLTHEDPPPPGKLCESESSPPPPPP